MLNILGYYIIKINSFRCNQKNAPMSYAGQK